jgi:signal transduction histidine kinase
MESRSRALLASWIAGLMMVCVTSGAGLAIFARIRSGEAAVRGRFLERSRALERIRGAVFLSGALARDYAAEQDPALLDRMRALRVEATDSLESYSGSADVVNLRGELAAYWKVLDLMTEMAQRRRTPALDAYFRAQLAQRRETMLRIAGEVGAALESEIQDRETELARMYNRLRWAMAGATALALALGAAIAIVTARRLAKLEAKTRALSAQVVSAQEAERRSIARELHDEVGQALTALLLDVGAAASAAPPGPARSRLDAIARTGERIMEEVRRIALSLRPSMLDDLGLGPALEWQAREVGRRSGLDVQVLAADAGGELPDSHRICIYRVAQEALQNCVRHSGASAAQVVLRRSNGTVTLTVEDNGKGFDAARTKGVGLMGMEERIAQLGGRLLVESAPGRGTTISAELPL